MNEMNTTQGRVVEVSIEYVGDVLIQDHLLGDTTLYVNDVSDFDEGGGQLCLIDLDGTLYVMTYTSRDDDSDLLFISTPLPKAFLADTDVRLYPFSESKRALVSTYEEEDGIRALIPFEMHDKFDDGIREDNQQESVLIRNDTALGWVVVDATDNGLPRIGGEYVIPPPEGIHDGLPPAYAPTITARGTINAVVVAVEPIVNADPVLYEYHISPTAFTATAGNPSTVVYTGPETTYFIRTLADQVTKLVTKPTTTYYVRVFAKDVDGYGPVSAQVSAAPLQVTGPDIAAGAVDAEQITGRAVTADKLAATIALLSAITVGASIRINPTEGIIIETPIGDTHFPADGSDPSIAGNAQLQRATIADFLTVLGLNNALDGTITAGDGISNPKNKPAVISSWSQSIHSKAITGMPGGGVGFETLQYAMCEFDASNWLVQMGNPGFYGSGQIYKVNKTTGAATSLLITTLPTDWYQTMGMTKVGSNFHVCVAKFNGFSFESGIAVINSSGTYLGMYFAYGWALHYDGTNVLIARPGNMISGGGHCYIDRTSGVPSYGSTPTLTAVAETAFDMNPIALQGGTTSYHDFGAVTRYVVLNANTGISEVIGTGVTATRYTANAWNSPDTPIGGLYYDVTNSRWLGVSPATGHRIWSFAKNIVTTARSVKYTWYRGVATTRESMASPAETYNQPPRTPFKVTGDVIPKSTPLAADEPDRVRIYIANQLQPALAASAISDYYLEPSAGAGSPGVNGFSGFGAFGIFRSAALFLAGHPQVGNRIIEFKGDGSGRVGSHKWGVNGAPVEEAVSLSQAGTNGTTISTSSGTFIRHPALDCEGTFTAPSSGCVYVEVGFYLIDPTTLVLGCPEVRVGGTVGSGSVFYGASVSDSVGGQFDLSAPTGVMRYHTGNFVRGLTPGDTYNAYLALYRTAAGESVTNPFIRVTPMR